jgi:asparagine synthase (glutamine-hydrolysing)
MSGVCGLVIPGASQVDSIADTMLARLAHYPWHVTATSANTGRSAVLGAAVLDWRGPVVVSDPTGRWTLALDGELFETEAELARLRTAGFGWAAGSDASLLLAGWMHEGPAFLARLNGEFSAIGWDAERRELHGITDRFGLRPLYVATPAGACAFATEITALLAMPGGDRGWSHDGVSQFFAFGHFFGDETLLSGVRAVPAASYATFRAADGVYTTHPYWRLTPGSVRGSADDLSRAFDDRFVRAVERRARPGEHLGLSLSGGLDARTILGVMPADRDLKTVSLGIEGSLDHKSAAELAALAGVEHHAFTLGRDFLAEFERHLREMISLTDGHYLDQGIVMPTMPLYRDLKIEHLMRGHGGELLHMTKAYAFSLDAAALSASASALDGWLFDHLTGYMLGGVPADLFTIDLRAGARASLARALERCVPTDRPVDRVWQLFLNERIHRETALSMHMFGSFAGIRQPYLDNDVIDVLFSMPASLKLGDELQTRLLRHRRPAFLDVTNSNTGARMGAGRLETALAKLRLKVGAKLGWKGYQPYERLGLWLKQELRPLVEATVTGDRLLSSGLFRPDVVRRIVQQHVEGQANHTFLLMSLVIFALGMEWREKANLSTE